MAKATAVARMFDVKPNISDIPSAVFATFGALAQLGERLICIQEVNGSIPLGSTMTGIGSVAQVVRAHA